MILYFFVNAIRSVWKLGNSWRDLFCYIFSIHVHILLFVSQNYSSGQNKVPTAELKSRLIVVQKSFDSRAKVV